MDIKYYLPLKKFRQQVNARLAFVEDEISWEINNFFFHHTVKLCSIILKILF